MGLRRSTVAAGFAASIVLVGVVSPAWASGNRLRWNYPSAITSGQSFQVSSIDPCPAPPNPADQVMAQIFVAIRNGGGFGDTLSLNPDGSWSGSLNFNFTPTPRTGDIGASCVDVTQGGAPYAVYQSHKVVLNQ